MSSPESRGDKLRAARAPLFQNASGTVGNKRGKPATGMKEGPARVSNAFSYVLPAESFIEVLADILATDVMSAGRVVAEPVSANLQRNPDAKIANLEPTASSRSILRIAHSLLATKLRIRPKHLSFHRYRGLRN